MRWSNLSNSPSQLFDHLFRLQYGRMVSVLTGIFGPSHLELIEDAVQDTFLQATLKWRNGPPENPEAWLTQAAKNRTIDLLRQIKSRVERHESSTFEYTSEELDDRFLDHEVQDSQLRMLFLACHPIFSPEEQIAFALKSISGFSQKEIAAALLKKEESIKKRLQRARKKIKELEITLEYPLAHQMVDRLQSVTQIIYLIFNEGFHSTKENTLIDKELCGEAIRLCQLILRKESLRNSQVYALFSLLCLNASRLETRIVDGEIVDLKNQDRSQWHLPLIVLGNDALTKAAEYEETSLYLFEALIAREHIQALNYENTNWHQILEYYRAMLAIQPSEHISLSIAVCHLQMQGVKQAEEILQKMDSKKLHQRAYLFHGALAELNFQKNDKAKALEEIQLAMTHCTNSMEKRHLMRRQLEMERLLS